MCVETMTVRLHGSYNMATRVMDSITARLDITETAPLSGAHLHPSNPAPLHNISVSCVRPRKDEPSDDNGSKEFRVVAAGYAIHTTS